jgi:hypothetical protein
VIESWHVAFTDKGWVGHVSAFGYDAAAGVWVVVDPALRSIQVRALLPGDFDVWIAGLAPTAKAILKLKAREQSAVILPGLWCVGVVKRLLGLRSGALSPWGLRRDMIRAGATPAFALR